MPQTLQCVGNDGEAGAPCQVVGKQGSLVVAATEQAAAVQRDRHEQVGRLEQGRTGACHVEAQYTRVLLPVVVFQRQDQPARIVVIDQGGARMPPCGRGCPASVAHKRIRHRVAVERNATMAAARIGDEADLPETLGAKLADLVHQHVATGAVWRQQQVEHRDTGRLGKVGKGFHNGIVSFWASLAKCHLPAGLGSGGHSPHLPCMAEMHVFDRRAVRLHRERAAATVSGVAPILEDAAARLLDRLDDTTHRFTQALDVGGRGIVAPMLRARGIHTVSLDLSPAMAAFNGRPAVAGDEEALPFAPGSFDLVVASLSLHWVNDLPGALIQLRQALRPDGLLLASLPALGTLGAFRTALAEAEFALAGGASPRVSPFPDLRDCAALLQRAGFALPVADGEDISILYADPAGLLRDLRAAGEGNAVALRDKRIPSRMLIPAALAALPIRDGRLEATLRLACMTGWAPAPTQPRPLQPGSGQVSLAAVLGTEPPA